MRPFATRATAVVAVATVACGLKAPLSLSRHADALADTHASLRLLSAAPPPSRQLSGDGEQQCLTAGVLFWASVLVTPACYSPQWNASFNAVVGGGAASLPTPDLLADLDTVCHSPCLAAGVAALRPYATRSGLGCSDVRSLLTVLNVLCMTSSSSGAYCYPSWLQLSNQPALLVNANHSALDSVCVNHCTAQLAWALAVSAVNVTSDGSVDRIKDDARVAVGVLFGRLLAFLCLKEDGEYCAITLRDLGGKSSDSHPTLRRALSDGGGPAGGAVPSHDIDPVNDHALVCSTCGRAYIALAAAAADSDAGATRRLSGGDGGGDGGGGGGGSGPRDGGLNPASVSGGGARNISAGGALRKAVFLGCGTANGHRCLEWFSAGGMDDDLRARLEGLANCSGYIVSVSAAVTVGAPPATCSLACSAAFHAVQQRIGCCGFAYLALAEAAGAIPSAAAAAAGLHTACDVDFRPCRGSVVRRIATRLVGLRYAWAASSDASAAAFRDAHVQDLAAATGADASSFTVVDMHEGSVVVVADVQASSDEQTGGVADQAVALTSSGSFGSVAVLTLAQSSGGAAYSNASNPYVSTQDATSGSPSGGAATALGWVAAAVAGAAAVVVVAAA